MSSFFSAVTGAACGLVQSCCVKTWAQSNLHPASLYPLLSTVFFYFFCSWKIACTNCVLLYSMYHSSKCHFPTLVIQISHSWPTCSQNDHFQEKNCVINIRFLEHTGVPCISEMYCGSSVVFGTYSCANLLILIIIVTGIKCQFFSNVFLRINFNWNNKVTYCILILCMCVPIDKK